MKIIAISGLLLVGVVSVVSAEPAKTETAERVSYTTKETAESRDDDWTELASPTPAKHGRTFITVEGRYTQLRIAPHKGRPIVKTVRVVYADGKQRTFKVKKPVIDLG